FARRVVRELLDTGHYAEIEAYAAPAPGGVALQLFALPRRIVSEVRIAGGVLDETTTRQAADVDAGDDITVRTLPRIVERLRSLYARRGFPSAHIEARALDTDEELEVV